MLTRWKTVAITLALVAILLVATVAFQAVLLHAGGWRFAWGAVGTVVALVVSIVSVVIALASVRYARQSAEAATRSADLAEVVEAGRHFGWRIEARTNENPRNYTLRNVGTVDARDVRLSGDYHAIEFLGTDDRHSCDVAAGQGRLFMVAQGFGDSGGNIDITWTPALPDAEPMTWTETPPMAPFMPRLRDGDWRNIRKLLERLAKDD